MAQFASACLTLVVLALPLRVAADARTGARVAVTQKLLDRAVEVAVPILEDFVTNFPIPDAKGSLGPVDINIHDTKLSRPMSIGSTHQALEAPDALNFALSNVDIEGNFHVQAGIWFAKVDLSGSFKTTDASASLKLKAGVASDTLELGLKDLDFSLGGISFHVDGIPSWLDGVVDWLVKDAAGIVDKVENFVKDAITQAMPKLNSFLAGFSYQLQMPLPAPFNQILLDFHTTSVDVNTDVNPAYLMLGVTGDFRDQSRPDVPAPLDPGALPSLPSSDLSSHMGTAEAAVYTINSALYQWYHQRILLWSVQPTDLPKNVSGLLTTNFWKTFVPVLGKTFPDKNMSLFFNFSAGEHPVVHVDDGIVNATGKMMVSFAVNDVSPSPTPSPPTPPPKPSPTPPPPTPSPPTPSPPTAWTRKQGLNCYSGHGATNIDTDPIASLSVAACEAKCEEMTDCTGITIETDDNQVGDCWRRKDINPSQCDTSFGAKYDTWLRPSTWTRKQGLNCYGGHGATEIDKDPMSSASVSACQAKCEEMPNCTGITIETDENQPGDCWRRRDIVPDQCDTSFGVKYDTWLRYQSSPSLPSPPHSILNSEAAPTTLPVFNLTCPMVAVASLGVNSSKGPITFDGKLSRATGCKMTVAWTLWEDALGPVVVALLERTADALLDATLLPRVNKVLLDGWTVPPLTFQIPSGRMDGSTKTLTVDLKNGVLDVGQTIGKDALSAQLDADAKLSSAPAEHSSNAQIPSETATLSPHQLSSPALPEQSFGIVI